MSDDGRSRFTISEIVLVNERCYARCLTAMSTKKSSLDRLLFLKQARVTKFHHSTLPIVEIRSNYLYDLDLSQLVFPRLCTSMRN